MSCVDPEVERFLQQEAWEFADDIMVFRIATEHATLQHLLLQYQLGYSSLAALTGITERELLSIGMKRIPMRRFLEAVSYISAPVSAYSSACSTPRASNVLASLCSKWRTK